MKKGEFEMRDAFKLLFEADVVLIEWVDAQSSLNIIDVSEFEDWKPLISKSVGFNIHSNKHRVVLAFTCFGDDLIKHFQVIPQGMIVKKTVLKKGVNVK